jgi:hypothetical protein
MDETTASEKGLTVLFGQIFIDRFNNFPVKDQKKIFEFVEHLKTKGFSGLAGRNKSSIDVDKNDSDFLKKVTYARDNCLYHYHIGIPYYDESNAFGDWTSGYILHYKYSNGEITILDLDSHPPFILPAEKFLI